MIQVTDLEKGIVIDHIREGNGYKMFQQLGLDKLPAVVVLMRNVNSTKMGCKDIIKIETDLELNFDVLGLVDPGATVTYVTGGKVIRKQNVALPQEVHGILSCKNPRCVSNQEKLEDIVFRLVEPGKREYACEYCDARTHL